MSTSILTHRVCGGNVVGVVTGIVLVSPFFNLSYSKLNITRFELQTDDYKVPSGVKEVPVKYVCKKCCQVVDDVAKDVMVMCGICGEQFPVGDILVTDYIPLICAADLGKIKTGDDKKLSEVYSFPQRIRRKALVDLMTATIKI